MSAEYETVTVRQVRHPNMSRAQEQDIYKHMQRTAAVDGVDKGYGVVGIDCGSEHGELEGTEYLTVTAWVKRFR